MPKASRWESCWKDSPVTTSNFRGELSTAASTSQPTVNSTGSNPEPDNSPVSADFSFRFKKPNPIGHGRPRKQALSPLVLPSLGSATSDVQFTLAMPSPSQSSQSGPSLISGTPTPEPEAITDQFCSFGTSTPEPEAITDQFCSFGTTTPQLEATTGQFCCSGMGGFRNQPKSETSMGTGPRSAGPRPETKTPIQQDYSFAFPSKLMIPGLPPFIHHQEPDLAAFLPNTLQQDMPYVPPPASTSMAALRSVKAKQDEAISALMSRTQLETSLASGATCLDTLRRQRRLEEDEQKRQLRDTLMEQLKCQSYSHEAALKNCRDKFNRGHATIHNLMALETSQSDHRKVLYGQFLRTFIA
ncbi:hypothetical protein DL95DRAFT_412318 [Leptodontidium sp. 2 PMI_412]|nr:hypothetical protein DL95DRAFT_412318 [Leptodontidium sp. 2 PMI_412]